MHIHILGICGTFMGSLAVLAKQAGHHVTGCDHNVYPPMSTQLETQGIQLISGFDASQIQLKPDLFIIGNVVSRGNALMEEILNQKLPYISGPQWLGENILHKKWVLAVAGTHGKTTTATLLAWILEKAGLNPNYLIGGVPLNFDASARLTESLYFVIEADEYDTAFFDKRSKFVHYRPKTLILNNLEFDHADIFDNVADIQKQFHHVVRTVPKNGQIVCNAHEVHLDQVLDKGLWSDCVYFGMQNHKSTFSMQIDKAIEHHFDVYYCNEKIGKVTWNMLGKHNQFNALAAIAAAYHAGVSIKTSIDALNSFSGIKRRMEVKGEVNNIIVYDDFAHHPTAIQTTLEGLRAVAKDDYIIAVLEPRSNTMKMGAIKEAIPNSLNKADFNFIFADHASWNVNEVFASIANHTVIHYDLEKLIQDIVDKLNQIKAEHQKQLLLDKKYHVVIMSNGGFGGVHQKLLNALK
jgi:UDP-N-acetylmuramate: L-alanyl-gamma-D-glutamyl-meso-diaminopimelate ligase